MLKGKQKQLDKNHNDKIDADDFAMMRGDKKTDEAMDALKSLAGIKEAAKPDYIDLDKDGNKKESMKKAAADKKTDVEEEVTDEGNEFSGELAKARAAHKDEFEVGGKTYKVEGNKMDESILELMKLAGQLTPYTPK